MIKGVIFDIDNTIYSHYSESLPSLSLKALKELKNNKIKIGINTSREIDELGKLPKEIFDYADLITTGSGAHSFNQDIDITHPLPVSISNLLIDYFIEHNISYRASLPNGNVFFSKNTTKENILKLSYFPLEKAVFHEAKKDEYYNSFLIFDKNDLDLNEIRNLCSGFYIFEWENAADILADGVSKASGIDDFCEYFKLTSNEVACFGDGANDIQMLEKAGYGIAMKQSDSKLLSLAEYVCENDIDNGGIYFELIKLGAINPKFDYLFVMNLDEFDNSIKAVTNRFNSILLTEFEHFDFNFKYVCNKKGLFEFVNNEYVLISNITFDMNNSYGSYLNVCHFLNIDRMKTIVFSDKINELDLLNKVGLGVLLTDDYINIGKCDYCIKVENGIFNTLKQLKIL